MNNKLYIDLTKGVSIKHVRRYATSIVEMR